MESNLIRFLTTKQSIVNILFPIIIYSISFYYMNIDSAILLSAAYAVIILLIDRKQAKLPILLLLIITGFFQYSYDIGLFTLHIKNEGVFLAIMNSITLSVIFFLYTFFKYPIIRIFAEMGSFFSKPLNEKNKKPWVNISYIWVVVYLAKAIVIFIVNKNLPLETSSLVYITSWPLTIFMVYISIKYIKQSY